MAATLHQFKLDIAASRFDLLEPFQRRWHEIGAVRIEIARLRKSSGCQVKTLVLRADITTQMHEIIRKVTTVNIRRTIDE